ncbi:MAG: Gfo/Idh/MocA family oxidoreductase [Armatimonadetes bacterium]|nr:Gfo/Idh/MocA family oxidoreductase [Armatimonadota bacterium]
MELGIGMAGFGFIGKVHAYAYRTLGLFYDPAPVKPKLVGVCTSRPESAAKAAEVGEFDYGTTSFEALLHDDRVQVIDIASPNHVHEEEIIGAVGAGKHVYCDKPLTTSLASARRIEAALRARPEVKHGMTFHMRFIPAALRARELIAEGFLGRVYHFHAAYYHAGYTDPTRPLSWRLTAEAGGGALSDLGSHVLDLMSYLLGDYAAVRASLETFIKERPAAKGSSEMKPVQVDDYVALQARMQSGALGYIEASRFATGAQDGMEFVIFGEQGALKFNMMDPNFLYAYDATEPEADLGGRRGWMQIECVQRYPKPSALPAPKLPIGWMRFHVHCLYDFLSAVAEDRLGTATIFDGVKTQAVDEAVRQSAAAGEWVEVGRSG